MAVRYALHRQLTGSTRRVPEGSSQMAVGEAGLMSKVDVVVATPGRLIAHMRQTEGFTLQHLRYLVRVALHSAQARGAELLGLLGLLETAMTDKRRFLPVRIHRWWTRQIACCARRIRTGYRTSLPQ